MPSPNVSSGTEKKSHRIAAIGELLWDRLPAGPRLGGAPANFASLCANLPQPKQYRNEVFLISQVGEDAPGHSALEQMRAHRVHTGFIVVDPSHPTGAVDVTFEGTGEPVYEICDAVAWDFLCQSTALNALAPTLDAVCFGTLAQRSPQTRRTLRRFVELTRPDCVRVFDVNLRDPFWNRETVKWGCAHATIVKMNQAETIKLAGIFGCDATDDIRAAEFLWRRFSARLVAVTRGAQGCMFITEQERCEMPADPVQVVDPVGAGDAFTAALTDAFLRGEPLAGMAKTANFWGGWAAGQSGGMPLPGQEKHGNGTLLISCGRDQKNALKGLG